MDESTALRLPDQPPSRALEVLFWSARRTFADDEKVGFYQATYIERKLPLLAGVDTQQFDLTVRAQRRQANYAARLAIWVGTEPTDLEGIGTTPDAALDALAANLIAWADVHSTDWIR